MGHFFASGGSVKEKRQRGLPSVETLHRLECRICPLNEKVLDCGKLKAAGATDPLVYVISDSPCDSNGRHLTDAAETVFMRHIPEDWHDFIRWNSTVRCETGQRPEYLELEACRPSIEKDIAKTKPIAIIGLGYGPLRWATGESGKDAIDKWRGRRIPVNIAGHACWFYPVFDPSWVIMQRRRNDDTISGNDALHVGSENERMLLLDLKRAFDEIAGALPKPVIHSEDSIHEGIEIVTGAGSGDLNKVQDFLEWAVKQKTNGVDYETKGTRPYPHPNNPNPLILTAAVFANGRGIAFPFDHRQSGWSERKRRDLTELWKWYCVQPKVKRCVHSLPFELEWTAHMFGVDTIRQGKWEDSVSQASVLDDRVGDSKPGCFALDFLVKQYFGLSLKGLSPVDRKRLHEEPLIDVLKYNGPDAKYHDLLWQVQNARLIETGLLPVYLNHLPRIKAFTLTQLKGVLIDKKVVQELDTKYELQIKAIEKKIAAMPCAKKFKERFGRPFNPNSNKGDVLPMFRDVLKCDVTDDRDNESTDEKTLSKIDHPLAPAILELRGVGKLRGSYILSDDKDGYIFKDGCAHQVLNSVFTATGRSSAEDPALQTYPKRDGDQKIVRKQVVARPGHAFLPIDYGQIQFRNIAMESKDPVLVKALWERYDVHTEWVYKIAHAAPAWMDPKEQKGSPAFKKARDSVKNEWTFPLCFGARLESVAGYMRIDPDKLAPLYDEFWETFSGVKAWQERIIKFYKKNGYVTGCTGRRRVGPLSVNQLINAPIQSDESEIVLAAMARLSEMGIWDYQPVLEIHDDLTFEVPEKKVDEALSVIVPEMLRVEYDWINVPLVVEVSMGRDWYESEKVDEYWSDHVWPETARKP